MAKNIALHFLLQHKDRLHFKCTELWRTIMWNFQCQSFDGLRDLSQLW